MNTLLNPEEIMVLLSSQYSLAKIQSCSLIRRGFNDHYLVELESAKYIFRVYLNHKYYIESPEAFQFELDLLEHLHNDSLPVVNAVRLNTGGLLGRVRTDYGDRFFALFPYASGAEIKGDEIAIEQWSELGKTMAQLHISANHFHSKLKRYHLDLKYLVDEPLRLITEKIGDRSTSDQDKDELQDFTESFGPVEPLVDAIKSIDLSKDEFGIIHGDMHTGNVHFQDNKVVVFDFDHCAYGWRAYDISICFFLPSPQCESMLKGYESQRSLSEQERKCLPVFAKLRRLWDIGDMLATESLRAKPL